ncbi:MAG: MBL fold metallo-hydrolase, partial [Rhodospirillaceae bacterium]
PHTVLVENGSAVKLADRPGDDASKAHVAGTVWNGRLALEDGKPVPLGSPVLRDRKRMFYDGAAVVTVTMDDDGEIACDPHVDVLGIADPLSEIEWDKLLSKVVARLPKKVLRDDESIEETLRAAVRKVFAPARKPVVKVHLQRI